MISAAGNKHAVGRKTWVIPAGYLPKCSHSPEPMMTSHETICILSAGLQGARTEITIYFADRQPSDAHIISVAPGAAKKNAYRDVWGNEERARELRLRTPYDRTGDPEDIARPVAWLVSDDADYIAGATTHIDGGMTLYPAFREKG